jgi:hypothetical protein
MTTRLALGLVVVALGSAGFLVGCSSSDSGGATSNAANTTTPATTTACSTDTRKDVYAAGMTKPAGPLTVKLVDSDPGPPIKGTNTMTVEVTDASGAPVDGAKLTVTPFMPDHGHGSSVVPTVTPSGGGKYVVANVYFVMAGLWRVTFSVQSGTAPEADAIFNFCLDG